MQQEKTNSRRKKVPLLKVTGGSKKEAIRMNKTNKNNPIKTRIK